ncbi:hypothetical protein F5879DRAFT_930210 [Lentinula edodes]|nr:hypothetical protein F5879DRAFT_930210 [Lentinula edodes]
MLFLSAFYVYTVCNSCLFLIKLCCSTCFRTSEAKRMKPTSPFPALPPTLAHVIVFFPLIFSW